MNVVENECRHVTGMDGHFGAGDWERVGRNVDRESDVECGVREQTDASHSA